MVLCSWVDGAWLELGIWRKWESWLVAGRGLGPRRLGAVEDVAGNLADGIGRRQRRD